MATAALAPPKEFDVDTEGGTNSSKWISWIRRFNRFMVATAITEDKMKIATLLTAAGEAIEEIYDVNMKTGDKYDDVVKTISDHFKPMIDTEAEIIKFRLMTQKMGETIDSYVVRLKTAAKSCNFDAQLELQVKLQLIMSAQSLKVRNKGKAETITLADLLKFARAAAADTQASKVPYSEQKLDHDIKQEKLNELTYQDENYLNHVKSRKTKHENSKPPTDKTYGNGNKKEKCQLCGFILPHRNDRDCNACHQLGHFASVCKAKKKSMHALTSTGYNSDQQSSSGADRHQQLSSGTDRTQFFQTDQDEDDFVNEHHMLFFTVQSNSKQRPCPTINVRLGKYENEVNFGIDTQASLNAVSYEAYSKMKNPPVLRESKLKAWSYDGKKPIESPGMFLSQISANGRINYAQFFVYYGIKTNLLCWDTCVELGICQENLGMNQLNAVDIHSALLNRQRTSERKRDVKAKKEADQMKEPTLTPEQQKYKENIVGRFPNVFSGKVGCLKDYELELHIDKTIKPKVAAKRPQPFHLKEAIEKELRSMLEDDIIEFATGPTTWVSELVKVPKASGNPLEFRLVMDGREPNEAIMRERHNCESLENLAAELNGAKVMSKADLKGGFHQIKINERSRYITTTRSSLGLIRWKRLTMGICCSSEAFQHIISNELEGQDGVRNLVDDIFIWGNTQQEHDERLIALMERLDKEWFDLE